MTFKEPVKPGLALPLATGMVRMRMEMTLESTGMGLCVIKDLGSPIVVQTLQFIGDTLLGANCKPIAAATPILFHSFISHTITEHPLRMQQSKSTGSS